MASAYSKRLAKLEELLASKINKPLAYLWLNAGETREEACVRAGYDPSQAGRINFVRWLDPELGEAPKEYSWDVPEAGSPKDETPRVTPDPEPRRPVTPDPVVDPDAETRYREAIERREAELVAEKLHAETKAFAKTIV